jgi:type III pantothenate kinase
LRRSGGALRRALRAAGADAALSVGNVGGALLAHRIRAAARAAGLRPPWFARSVAAAAGVVNGYAEAWRLGVDRWLALIGAHHRYLDRDLCIVGIGSAMTIDLLTAGGWHQGGSIVPAPHMMIDALLRNTAGISRRAGARSAVGLERALERAPAGRAGLFARDTRSGLFLGCRHACALLIEYALEQARQRLSHRPDLILTGGGIDLVAPLLRVRYRRDEDLVLRGLAVLAVGRDGP